MRLPAAGSPCRAQQKAKEAVATVSAVTTAGKQLGAAQANATGTLGKLQEAAQQLDLISNKGVHNKSASSHDKHGTWDIGDIFKVSCGPRQS